MAVSKRTRYEVLRRDSHACRYCGGLAPDVKLTIDHVLPIALGGTDDPSNLVAACHDCNAGKSSTASDAALVAEVAEDAMRWAAAIKQASALIAADTEERTRLNGEFYDLWTKVCDDRWLAGDWPETLDTFRKRGLPEVEIVDAFWISLGKAGLRGHDYWRYFCGVCWRKIDNLNEAARALLESDGGA